MERSSASATLLALAVLAASTMAPKPAAASSSSFFAVRNTVPTQQQAEPAAAKQAKQSEQKATDQAAGGEAAGDQAPDENDQYRLSPVARKMARLLHLEPRTASVLFEVINFLILALGVAWVIKRIVPRALQQRGVAIERQLVEAREATEDANRRLREVEQRLSRLDDEIVAMRDRSEREIAAEEDRLRAEMEEERKRIVAAAEQEVTAAGAHALRGLKQFAAEVAVERAVSRLNLSAEGDQILVRDFASRLGAKGVTTKPGATINDGSRN